MFTSCKAFGLETFRWTTQHFYIIIILHLQNLWTYLACKLMVVQVWFFWCWSNIIESTWGHKWWCCLCCYYKCKFAQYNYRGTQQKNWYTNVVWLYMYFLSCLSLQWQLIYTSKTFPQIIYILECVFLCMNSFLLVKGFVLLYRYPVIW